MSAKKQYKYLIVRRASMHGNLLARKPNLVVPGKWTVLNVEPWRRMRRCAREEEGKRRRRQMRRKGGWIGVESGRG
jgi:hypothetical protein